jgi:hypothetical protein
MSTAQIRLTSVTLDMGDAIELSEMLDYLADWLRTAGHDVRADLARFALDHTAPGYLPAELTRFSRLLILGHDDTPEDEREQGQEAERW